jgi:hypothetical protein
MSGRVTLSAIGVVAVLLAGAGAGRAQVPLQYHGGPYLEQFTVYPLFWGKWSPADKSAQQGYLRNLAAYLSGESAPAGEEPALEQYGVINVTIADFATAATQVSCAQEAGNPCVLSRDQIAGPKGGPLNPKSVIAEAQAAGKLPPFGPATLIMVFLPHNYTSECNGTPGDCGSYHSSESTSEFFAVVPQDEGTTPPLPQPTAFEVVSGHELFEAATDPAIDDFQGWDEVVDPCDDAAAITLPSALGGITIPAVSDNTNAGQCSTTGYVGMGELTAFGLSPADLQTQVTALLASGWHLHFLEGYALPGGVVRYDAVWRQAGNVGEVEDFGVSAAQLSSDDATNSALGYRLYLFQSHVIGATPYYNAVWRQTGSATPGWSPEYTLGLSYPEFLDKYANQFAAQEQLDFLAPYDNDGIIVYDAVWRPGTTAEAHVEGKTARGIGSAYRRLGPGWRYRLLISYSLGSTILLDAVWRPASHQEVSFVNKSFAYFQSQYNSLLAKGYRLYILNTGVNDNGKVAYSAVFRKGIFERPL